MKTLSDKDRREWLSAIFYCGVERINKPQDIIPMLRKLKGSKRMGIEPQECNEVLRSSMIHTLTGRFKLLRKRGRLLNVTYKGHAIQVWEKNEHGWKFVPVCTQYVKDGDKIVWLPKFLYKHEFKQVA